MLILERLFHKCKQTGMIIPNKFYRCRKLVNRTAYHQGFCSARLGVCMASHNPTFEYKEPTFEHF